MNKKFSIKARIKSFKFALRGLKTLIIEEHNSRIHLFFTLLVLGFGLFFNISAGEWLIIILTISSVFICELINSALESLCDLHTSEYHPLIEKVKDYSSAAVLVAAIASISVGLIIFIPKIF